MTTGSQTFKQELELDARRYKNSKKNLPLINGIFIALTIIMLLLPLTWPQTFYSLAGLILLYGFFRVGSL